MRTTPRTFGDDVPSDSEFNGLVTGNGVRLRSEPTTSSDTVATLYRDTQVKVMETVTGQEITAEGTISDQWYHVETASGSIGYVSSIYVKMESPLASPTFSVEDGRLLISAHGPLGPLRHLPRRGHSGRLDKPHGNRHLCRRLPVYGLHQRRLVL